ncbi:MAG: hypothetical protein H6Q33_5015 [Deltaproteobacteria bacterium]|nr:hypothetical protein [Deltaproteobacteria bacterium]
MPQKPTRRVPTWPEIRAGWRPNATTVLRFAVGFMFVGACVRLRSEGWRLLCDPERLGGIDLRLRHGDVARWFAGLPVYTGPSHAGYPPASQALLWPFVGWLDAWQARWFWGFTTAIAVAALTAVAIRESRAETTLERLFIALIFVSTYPAPITIGNGQLGIHVLTAMLCGLLLIRSGRTPSWRGDLTATALLLLATIKPSVTAPIFWVALFVPGRMRPLLLLGAGYVSLTLFAASFQPDRLVKLFRDLAAFSAEVMGTDPTPSLAAWMSLLGLQRWTLVAAAATFALCGVWVFRHRHADFWIVVGVSAIIARLWTYHQLYDDLLVFPAMIALYRIANGGEQEDGTDVLAGILLAITLAGQLAPGRLHLYPSPWHLPYTIGEPLVWITVLVFLAAYARRHGSPARESARVAAAV